MFVFSRTSVAGVKRKGLASELLAAKADSYHTSWVNAWDTLMPAELLAKVGQTLFNDMSKFMCCHSVQYSQQSLSSFLTSNTSGTTYIYADMLCLTPQYLQFQINSPNIDSL